LRAILACTQKIKKIKIKDGDNINLYDKRNEIISWCSFYVGSCVVFNNNCCCMWCRRRNILHQICMSRIGNDNVRQGIKIIFDDDNVHLSSCMLRKMWEFFFYMWAPFSNAIVITIFWSVSWVVMHSLSHIQHNKWIPKLLMVWPH
jgi:hypothetical protein